MKYPSKISSNIIGLLQYVLYLFSFIWAMIDGSIFALLRERERDSKNKNKRAKEIELEVAIKRSCWGKGI